MKLISWNCQGAYRKKADLMLALEPDIVVIQECEHPDKLVFGGSTRRPDDMVWFGDNPHKGLGVFSYSKYRFQLDARHDPAFKTILPIAVSGGDIDFTLFAIYANNPEDKKNQYIGQTWKAIHCYDALLDQGPSILTGDFNSNTIWDRKGREGNHSTLVDRLAGKDIHSIYHKHFKQEQGLEAHPTFYLYRSADKPYHLDYCFASTVFYDKLHHFEVGAFEHWIAHSDHLPLIAVFDF